VAVRRPADDWPDFTETARLQFWSLPNEVIEAFADAFPEFTAHPQRPSHSLDVAPMRNDRSRWRLRVEGYRALYSLRHGRPLIERILPRTPETYLRFARFPKLSRE
jgi:hypothetical protein